MNPNFIDMAAEAKYPEKYRGYDEVRRRYKTP